MSPAPKLSSRPPAYAGGSDPMNVTTLTFDTIDSTNTEALKHARQGAAEGLCIIARQQTAEAQGRRRRESGLRGSMV